MGRTFVVIGLVVAAIGALMMLGRLDHALEVLGAAGVPRAGLAAHLGREIEAAARRGGCTWAVMDGRRPLALFGAVPDSATARSARIWMLAANEAQRRPLAFARWSRRCLRLVMEALPETESFYNCAPAADGRQRAWLEWLLAGQPLPAPLAEAEAVAGRAAAAAPESSAEASA